VVDRVVIVGASGGIGQYLVGALQDMYPVCTFNAGNPIAYGTEEWYQIDICDLGLVTFLSRIVSGKKIVLVNAAGCNINAMGHKMTVRQWQRVIDVNLSGTYSVIRAFLPRMREAGWGRIINLSSVVGRKGVAGTAAYAASKAGLEGMTRALAIENATRGITVNSLALGYFSVGMISEVPQEIGERIVENIPMKRLGHPSNIDAAIRFLIKADYVTGTTINIDGGLT